MEKILIEIAAFCDPDLLKTVESAMKQADQPGRVRFAVCYQNDDLRDLRVLEKMENCKIAYLSEAEAKGPCYARYLCQQLLEDEKYVWQVDSHMRFVKHWDTEMVRQLTELNDEKAMMSYYPPNFKEGMGLLAVDDAAFDEPAQPTVIVPQEFREQNYFIKLGSIFTKRTEGEVPRSPFIAAGNFFARAEAHREVIHDPEMCWFGDELPMAVRLFTYGWNNYSPGKCYIYHQYERKNRAIPKSWSERSGPECKRLEQLLGLVRESDMRGYGFGKVRSLKEFEEYAGVNFRKKTVSEKARAGKFG